MGKSKLKVIHYLNQFFGQIGGEEKTDVGFTLRKEPVGPGVALQKELGDKGEVVATLICGDNYFVGDFEKKAEEGLKMIEEFEPDLFIAGPAFNAGRYGLACGVMCKIVSERLNIPVVTGMNQENPGVDVYRGNAYIVKTGDNAKEMLPVIKKMLELADAVIENKPNPELVSGDAIPSPYKYDYFPKGFVKNVWTQETSAERSVGLLLKKLRNEPFESDVVKPTFDKIEPPPPIKEMAKAKIAFVTDGGIIPPENPDRLESRACRVWGEYELDKLFASSGKTEYDVIHMGYETSQVMKNYNRMFPVDSAREFEKKGLIGKLNPTFYSTCGNCSIVERSRKMGEEIAERLVREEVDAVILTSA